MRRVVVTGMGIVSSIGNDIAADGKSAWFSGVGVAYDQGDFVGNFEYTWRRTDSYVPDTNGWEITGDYHEYAFGSRFDKDGNPSAALLKKQNPMAFARIAW